MRKAKLNLMKSDFHEVEKRIFPRFPYCYLTFKTEKDEVHHAFEVVDISSTGMQVNLKNGVHSFDKGQNIKGSVHWFGNNVEIEGVVKWATHTRFGINFSKDQRITTRIDEFLAVKNLVHGLKPLHQISLEDVEIPCDLKYWLRNDGPVEIFMWEHKDHEFSRFHIILLGNYIEWEDGQGVKTGSVLSKRDLDTPLLHEDEFYFQMDEYIDLEKIQLAMSFIHEIPKNYLSKEAFLFLERKLHIK